MRTPLWSDTGDQDFGSSNFSKRLKIVGQRRTTPDGSPFSEFFIHRVGHGKREDHT